MLTKEGDQINRETARYKFGGDPFAEYLWVLTLHGVEDDQCGEADWLYGWNARIGRHIVGCDSNGFVYRRTFRTETEAVHAMTELHALWGEYDAEEAW